MIKSNVYCACPQVTKYQKLNGGHSDKVLEAGRGRTFKERRVCSSTIGLRIFRKLKLGIHCNFDIQVIECTYHGLYLQDVR